MDYQQFYGKYGPESRVHDRMEGFGMPMPLLSRIQATPGSWEFFAAAQPPASEPDGRLCACCPQPRGTAVADRTGLRSPQSPGWVGSVAVICAVSMNEWKNI